MKKLVFILSNICFLNLIGNDFEETLLAYPIQTGYKFVGVPVFNYSNDYGFGFGALLGLYNFADGESIPYAQAYRLKALSTTQGRHDYYLFVDVPKLLGSTFRMDATFGVEYRLKDNYFGIGNNSLNSSSDNDVVFKSLRPNAHLNWIYPIYDFINVHVGYRFLYSDHTYELSSRLDEEAPLGKNGGRSSLFKVGLIFDRRDHESAPHNGILTEVSFGVSNEIFGGSQNFESLLFHSRHYYSLANHVVFAHRLSMKQMWGDVPFYEMALYDGYRNMEGLGGKDTIRGLLQNRYIDRASILMNTELRYDFITAIIGQTRYDATIIGFWDTGRVFDGYQNISLKHLRSTFGFGGSLAWNREFIIRGDVGFDGSGAAIYIGFGNIF